MKEYHISLTGHRPNVLGGWDIQTPEYYQLQGDLEAYIQLKLKEHEIVYCHSGLALGADTIWAKAILAVKGLYPERVKFVAECPMTNQPNKWVSYSDKQYWHHLMENADITNIYDEDFAEHNTRQNAIRALFARNNGMINACDELLVLMWVDTTSGGTHGAYKYAQKKNKHTVWIDPSKYFKKRGT